MPRRLPREAITKMLEVSGVRELGSDSSDEEVLDRILTMVWLSSGLPVGDMARCYAAVVDHLDLIHKDGPRFLEDLFFDRVTKEIATYGSTSAQEGSGIREADRSLAQTPGGLLEADGRGPAGELGRRERPNVEVSFGGPSEAPEDPEPMEGDDGGRSWLPW